MDIWTIIPGQLFQSGCPDRPVDDFDIEVDLAGCPPSPGTGTTTRNTLLIDHYIEDGPLPDLNQLEALVSNLCDELLDGRKVLVHCVAGINRSSLVTALVVRRLFGLSGTDTIAYIRSRVTPGERYEDMQALENPDFSSYVASLGPCEALRRL